MRLIDADLLYKAMQDAEDLARQRVLDTESTLPYPNNLNPSYTRYLAQMDERTKAKHMIADAPTVDAVPVRHGRWIDIDSETYTWKIRCSKCGHERSMMSTGQIYPMYCEGCGALMDGKDSDHEKAD